MTEYIKRTLVLNFSESEAQELYDFFFTCKGLNTNPHDWQTEVSVFLVNALERMLDIKRDKKRKV